MPKVARSMQKAARGKKQAARGKEQAPIDRQGAAGMQRLNEAWSTQQ
jgi:hypothetical protein